MFVSQFLQELTEEDKALLDALKQDIVSDGLRWSMESERKMIHLWKKLKLTEKELRTSSQEVINKSCCTYIYLKCQWHIYCPM